MKTRILVGTAGWSYPDWVGTFYDSAVKRGGDLGVYAATFDLVEINSTFYRIPPPRTAEAWLRKVADRPGFVFTAKAWQGFTHEADASWSRADVLAFREGLGPLAAAGRLGAVLLQFPWSFRWGSAARDHLRRLAADLGGVPLVLEVRHAGWGQPEALDFARSLGLSVASIDQPVIGESLEPRELVTGTVGYVRLHGRNYDTWFDRKAGRDARYDYLYTADELEAWRDRTRAIAERGETNVVFVVTNNHFRGQAPANALQLRSMLDRRRVTAPPSLLATHDSLAAFADPQTATTSTALADDDEGPGPLFAAVMRERRARRRAADGAPDLPPLERPEEQRTGTAPDPDRPRKSMGRKGQGPGPLFRPGRPDADGNPTDPIEVPRPRAVTDGEVHHGDRPAPEQTFVVEELHAGMRLDQFLSAGLPWRSRSLNQRLLAEGRARVERRGEEVEARKGTKLVAGDRVRVLFPPLEDPIRHAEIAAALVVLHEDEHLIVVDKPAGLVAHPVGRTRVNTLLNALHHRFAVMDVDGEPGSVPRLGHRLDRDTSGVCVVARDRETRRILQDTFERRLARKRYLAIVHGEPKDDAFPIDIPIGPHPVGVPKTLRAARPDLPGALPSRTDVEVIERLGGFAVVHARPHEGRQHQIRIHLAANGHPIVADELYGPGGPGAPDAVEGIEVPDGAPSMARQALHAEAIELPHPGTGEVVMFEAPWPEDIRAFVEALRQRRS